nr:class I SAM-dependent methyltransferase [Streptomyces scabichelini]
MALNFGFARARVLGTALELGVFTELARAPRSALRLAEDLGCDGEALRRLLDALAELGLLEGDDDRGRRPTPLSCAYLVEGAKAGLGGHFAEVLGQWAAWGALTEVVRGGRRPASQPRRGLRPGLFGGAFTLSVRTAFALVDAVGPKPAGRVLDLAAGGGEWGIALAASDPEARVVAHDEPEFLAGVRARVEEFGVAHQFSYQEADLAHPPRTAEVGFDTVVLAHTSRFAGPGATARLVAEAARRLRPGGTLLIADVLRQPPGSSSLHRSMLDLSLYVTTVDGGIPEPSALRALMEKSGVTPKENATRGLVTALTGVKQERQ